MSAISLSLLRAIMSSMMSPSGATEAPVDVAECRPLVAEDAGVAVVVGADRVPDPEVGQDAREDRHRVLDPRVLRIGLDPREGGLGARALHLELRHEHGRLAAALSA